MLIAMCGKSGAGKDTVADYICKEYPYFKESLATPIKNMVKDTFVLTDEQVYDRIKRNEPLENWQPWTVVKLLQIIGKELFRDNIDEIIWAKSLWLRIKNSPKNYILTDCRFPNEIEYFKSVLPDGEFKTIKIVRQGFDGKNAGLGNHVSESYDLKTDFTIINEDNKFVELYEHVDWVMKLIGGLN